MRGRVVGAILILAVVFIALFGFQYNAHLKLKQETAIAKAECYDATTCPQGEGNVAVPDITATGLIILGILVGIYLIKSDHTHRSILEELQGRRTDIRKDEVRKIVYSVLTQDEQKIVHAVRKQPGISQATLKLRVDMSKAKLSQLIKELEARNILAKEIAGKTHKVYVKLDI
ncbi:MAG: helix-turn-helix domain-containing protein [Candidatus Woesearchaeota archaeon]|nr:helix-turn-helix domain-containing protein [Candidatus Woesearchaeota archaeon]